MIKKCLACGYERKTTDSAPDYECPGCGRVYSKIANPSLQKKPKRNIVTVAESSALSKLVAAGIGLAILISVSEFLNTPLASNLVVPPVLANSSQIDRISTHEYLVLFENGTLTSQLAEQGQYTIVEGYTNSCGVCKVLESKFKPFLDKRNDVVIRKLHFPESEFRYTFKSVEEHKAHFDRMSQYRFNHVEIDGDNYQVGTCGTPHIEIYGPDRKLITTDQCGADNSKAGLDYLNFWLAAEKIAASKITQ